MADNPQSGDSLLGRAAEIGRDASIEGERGRYLKMQDVEQLIFGAPNTPEAAKVRDAIMRAELSPEYKKLKDRVMLAMRTKADDIFEVMRKKLKDHGANAEKTKQELDKLDAYLRQVGVIGQAVKVMNDKPPVPGMEGPKSAQDMVDPNEIMMLDRFATYLASINTEELVDMIFQNQDYITMLVESQGQQRKDIWDLLPTDPQGRPYDTVSRDVDKNDKPIAKFDLANPNYGKNIDRLRNLILGNPDIDGKEKSRSRQMTEATMWIGIVKGFGYEQRLDLVVSFLENNTLAETENFLNAAILSGAMTAHEVLDIYAVRKDGGLDARKRNLLKRLDDRFPDRLNQIVKQREEAKKEWDAAADLVAKGGKIDSAATHYLTFGKMAGMLLSDIGRSTVLVNVLLDIGDRIRTRRERGEGRVESFVKGVKDAALDKWVWFGIGETAIGADIVHPWIKSAIYAPSSQEKEETGYRKEEQYVHDEISAHPNVANYLMTNYDSFLAKAEKNEREGKSNDLYPGDVKLTDEQAYQFGYETDDGSSAAELAAAKIHRLFGICSNVLKINKTEDLEKYFDEKVFSH